MSVPVHRFLVWGTFDTGKPRVRMLLEALQLEDPDLPICHRSLWAGIVDKSQVKGLTAKLVLLLRWLKAYPRLIMVYLRAPAHEVVVVPYPGNLDVLLLWPLARLRGARICWDMFLSLYDTTVIDRALVKRRGVAAGLLYACEWLSTRAADRILLDTREHAAHITTLFRLSSGKVSAFWVGVETQFFSRADKPPVVKPVNILFYGQFIPLHGLDTIIDAIALVERRHDIAPPTFTIVGTGQEQERIDRLIAEKGLKTVKRITWVNYPGLSALIVDAAICLGIFAPEGKSMRVIPNKIFQILASGRPLVTMDSPAIRELVQPGPALRLVPPGNAQALAATLIEFARDLAAPGGALAVHQSAISTMPRVDASIVRDQFIAATETL